MRAQEAVSFKNISATTAAFSLAGGTYGATVAGSNFGTVTLQRQAGDGSTWVNITETFLDNTDAAKNVAVGVFAANGYRRLHLADGVYRWAISSATAVYADIIRIPGE